ncbi:hypothetical protein PSI22_09345 [Xenorhabdus sp. XENO-7]|uniref:Uncharacterized protein n=1 Tax=Xenorhabdus aichiensis TaxID=3025874 RepID=A0ABT5M4E2_9GAMM|nr:hypothetical protein [Xenorhabdus aichiensis]MDC9621835.1 hypothetical protein [Xenorhabdus aichiensis]
MAKFFDWGKSKYFNRYINGFSSLVNTGVIRATKQNVHQMKDGMDEAS